MILLQAPVPGGPELVVILLLLLLPVGLGYWVYADATRRGNDSAALWAVIVAGLTLLTLVGGVLAVIVYLWQRE